MFEKKLIGFLLVLAALGAVYTAHKYEVKKAVDEAVQVTKDQYKEEYLDDLTEKLEASSELNASLQGSIKEKNDKIDSISARLNSALNSLSKRPSRKEAEGSQHNDSICSSSITGSELSREDGEFLAREAAAAMSIVVERDFYYDAYIKVEKVMKELNE